MRSANDVLIRVKELLAENLTQTTLTTWFDDTEGIDLRDNTLVIYTPTPFKKDIITGRYGDMIKDALRQLFSEDMEILVLTGGEREGYLSNGTEKSGRPSPSELDTEYSFETFIVGSNNKYAHAAALSVAQMPGRSYNPLFIHGNTGLGKTHLMNAIANSIRKTHPHMKIVYRKSEDFVNEVIESLQRSEMPKFREKYRTADLLMLDDIQFIAGKESTQNEFFNTFDTLFEANKQIVLTSDRPPKEIYSITERLRYRFESGLLADIKPPEFEARAAILKSKAERLGLELPDAFITYIANNVTANIRQMEGTIKKIYAAHELLHQQITYEIINQAIRDILNDPNQKPSPSRIVSEVCQFFDISPEIIKSKNRRREAVLPRQVAMYLIRELTDLSLPDIGRELGKDHSTVLHAINKTTEEMKTNPSLRDTIHDLTNNIKNS